MDTGSTRAVLPSNGTHSTPQRSLLDLPPELLSEVAHLCDEQDKAFRERGQKLLEHFDLDSKIIEITKEQVAAGHGRSLAALSRSCKAAYAHACSYLFETLKVSQIGKRRTTYRYLIAQKHLHKVHRLHLNGSDRDDLELVISSLSQFSNLEELTITGTAGDVMFRRDPGYRSESTELALQKLAETAPRVRKLHLLEMSPKTVIRLLPLFTSLTSFHFKGELPEEATLLDQFAAGVAPLKDLHLDVSESDGRGAEGPFPPELENTKRIWPRLESLTLTIAESTEKVMPFVSRFHSTLQTLNVIAEMEEDEETVAAMTFPDGWHENLTFPDLRSIYLSRCPTIAEQIFATTTKTSFPNLSHLTLSYSLHSRWGFGVDDDIVREVFKNGLIRHLHYATTDAFVVAEDAELLVELGKEHQCHVEIQNSSVPNFPHKMFVEEVTEGSRAFITGYPRRATVVPNLRRIQQHIERAIRTAEKWNDQAGLYRLATLLRPIEYDRLAQLD
ncbi:hypothetical protein JCM3765_005513 [Sporobolomyces pararoseus]